MQREIHKDFRGSTSTFRGAPLTTASLIMWHCMLLMQVCRQTTKRWRCVCVHVCEWEEDRWKGEQEVEAAKVDEFKYLRSTIQSNRQCTKEGRRQGGVVSTETDWLPSYGSNPQPDKQKRMDVWFRRRWQIQQDRQQGWSTFPKYSQNSDSSYCGCASGTLHSVRNFPKRNELFSCGSSSAFPSFPLSLIVLFTSLWFLLWF